MGPDELASYVEDAADAVAGSSELGIRNTQLRLVEPFLECLGWDVRSPAVEAAFAVDGGDATVDYALLVDGEPAIFVDTLACETSLSPAHGDALLSAMAAAGVEWGILTNGRRFAFVARRGEEGDGFTCSLSGLPEHVADLDRFTPERASDYARGRGRRLAAASAIADRREAIETAIVGELRSVAGENADAVPREAVRALTASYLDEVLATVEPDGHDGAAEAPPSAEAATAPDGPDPDGSPDRDGGEARSDRAGDEGRSGSVSDTSAVEPSGGDGIGSQDHDVEGATRAELLDDGEYVARLFDGNTSICAVGGSSVAGTMKETADYLLEQHHLDAGLSLPYVPDDGGYAVLSRVPRHPNGEPMDGYVQLDAGPYLWTAGTTEERRARIETLVREAGLRVMFQGDWKPPR